MRGMLPSKRNLWVNWTQNPSITTVPDQHRREPPLGHHHVVVARGLIYDGSAWGRARQPPTGLDAPERMGNLMPRKAMNRLIASAFNGSTDAEKDAAVQDAMEKLRGEK